MMLSVTQVDSEFARTDDFRGLGLQVWNRNDYSDPQLLLANPNGAKPLTGTESAERAACQSYFQQPAQSGEHRAEIVTPGDIVGHPGTLFIASRCGAVDANAGIDPGDGIEIARAISQHRDMFLLTSTAGAQ